MVSSTYQWQSLVGMNLISSEPHKCCAHVSLYKLVVPESEVVVCSADEGRNSCPELHIFFSWHQVFFILYIGYKSRPQLGHSVHDREVVVSLFAMLGHGLTV